jgi:small GTP-binding protein
MSNSISTDIKIIVIGKSGSGKTSFVNKSIKNEFTEDYKATIVSEYNHKIVDYEGRYYRIQLWDLAGQDKSAKITKTFAKGSHGCVVLCEANRIDTRNE